MKTFRITQQGQILAHNLGVFDARTCSRIARAARTYVRRQEEACSYEWASGAKWDADEERLEARIRKLVAYLGEGYAVKFSGDPRGYCVYITTPDGRKGGDWGGRGIAALEPWIGK